MSDVEYKSLPNGTPNPKYVDLLDEDAAIAGQKFVCVSFVSPETILKNRELYLFGEFTKNWDLNKSMEKFGEFLNFISFKYNLSSEAVLTDFGVFARNEEVSIKANSSGMQSDYKNFLEKNEDRLTRAFSKQHNFQTNVRGLKIRGSFSTQEEAEMHAQKTRARDPNHDILIAPVGLWLPWAPDVYKTGRVEHMEPELNRLMQEKTTNEMKAKAEFDDRVKAAKREAIEENIRKAREQGNKLTQTIDDQGNLVGANTIDFSTRDAKSDEKGEA